MDDTEESIDTEITGENLASVFDEFGQIEGELMEIIMRNWKFDNTYSHMFDSCTRIILSPYFITVIKFILHSTFHYNLFYFISHD